MGGTGDPPVPGGDSPHGMGGGTELFGTLAFLETPTVIPSGQWLVPTPWLRRKMNELSYPV